VKRGWKMAGRVLIYEVGKKGAFGFVVSYAEEDFTCDWCGEKGLKGRLQAKNEKERYHIECFYDALAKEICEEEPEEVLVVDGQGNIIHLCIYDLERWLEENEW